MDTDYRTYKHSQDEVIRRTGRKTKSEVYKNMIWCTVSRAESQINIRPFRPDKPGTWDKLPEHLAVVIPETTDPDVVGAALALALKRGRTYAA